VSKEKQQVQSDGISVGVPVYNSQKTFTPLVGGLKGH